MDSIVKNTSVLALPGVHITLLNLHLFKHSFSLWNKQKSLSAKSGEQLAALPGFLCWHHLHTISMAEREHSVRWKL